MTTQPPTHQHDVSSAEAILRALREELRTIESRSAVGQQPAIADTPSHDRLQQLTQELKERWVIRPQPFTSRLPVVGRLIVLFRTLWNSISTRWYIDPIVQQQSDFNGAVFRLAQYMEQVLRAAQEEMRVVWDQGALYDRRSLEVNRSFAQLGLVLQSLEGQVQQLKALQEQSALVKLDARLTRLEGLLQASAAQSSMHAPAQPPTDLHLDAFAFQTRFRGSREEIKARQRPYLEYFRDKEPVADLGCGRGEFVELLTEAGIRAYGVDSDAGMVAFCREHGLPVEQGDLMQFLEEQEDASLGGVFAAQVVEHLPPAVLLAFFQKVYEKLRPGGVLLIETINPVCLWALASNYTADLTHQQPVHPETAVFLAESFGFRDAEVRYTSPYPELARLQPLAPLPEGASEPWREVLNQNIERLNGLLFTYQDYALIARKPD